MTVRFAPKTAGAAQAALHLTSPDQAIAPVDVPLTGAGAEASLSVSPLQLSFETAPLGQTVGPQQVTIRNTSNLPLSISKIVSSGDEYLVEAPSLPLVLEPNTEMTFAVSFRPAQIGLRPGAITIDTNSKPGAATVAALGTGSGGAPALEGGGCGCKVVPVSGGRLGLFAATALGAALMLRRRRSRQA